MILLACTNIKRQLRKSGLILVLCAVMVGFLSLYAGNIQASQDQLAALPQSIPVTAHISNLKGSWKTGLQISGDVLDDIEGSGFVRDMVCTAQMSANFAPETPQERKEPKQIKLTGANDLSACPIDTNAEQDAFRGKDAICIVSRNFMAENNLNIGDEITLAMYRFTYMEGLFRKEEFLDERTLKIVGAFHASPSASISELSSLSDIILPLDFVKTTFAENNAVFFADSASFHIGDPLHLNEFKSMIKAHHLMSVNPQAEEKVYGISLVVNDKTFISAAKSIKDNLRLLSLFMPLLIMVALLVGFVVSHVFMQSRQGEFAVMRSLGASKAYCLAVYLMEGVAVAAAGAAIGSAVSIILAGVPIPAGLTAAGIFWAAYVLGVLTAVSMLGRVSVAAMLTKTD